MRKNPFPIVAVALESPPRDAGETSYYRSLAAYAAEHQGLVYGTTPTDLAYATRRKVQGFPLEKPKGKKNTYLVPHVVYNRLRRRMQEASPIWQEAVQHLAYLNIPVVNAHFLDKWSVYRCLASTPLRRYLPFTILYESGPDLLRALAEKGSVYLKPRDGSRGEGIFVLTRAADSSRTNHAWKREGPPIRIYLVTAQENLGTGKNRAKKEVLLEEFLRQEHRYLRRRGYLIQNALPALHVRDRPADVRIVVIWDGEQWRVASAVLRLGRRGSPVSNIAQGGIALPLREMWPHLRRLYPRLSRTDAPLRRLARHAAQALNSCELKPIGELGVDLLLTPDGRIYLLELNAKPDKRSSRPGIPPTIPALFQMFVAFAQGRRPPKLHFFS